MSPENDIDGDKKKNHQHDEGLKEVDQESAMMVDKMENAFVPQLLGNENQDFIVNNPQLTGGSISYFCKGVDKQGPWEGNRRYRHFHALSEALKTRWPGVAIPKLPPKKAIVSEGMSNRLQNNKELKFIHERRYYLERFLRNCGKMEHIINSEEFIAFSRP